MTRMVSIRHDTVTARHCYKLESISVVNESARNVYALTKISQPMPEAQELRDVTAVSKQLRR